MQGCRTCWRRYRCNDKDRGRGMACKDYETGENQIKKAPVQSISEKVRNQATKKDMRLDRKRGTATAEAKADHRRERDRGRNRIRIGVRKHDHGCNINLLSDGGTVLEGGEEDARSGNDYDR